MYHRVIFELRVNTEKRIRNRQYGSQSVVFLEAESDGMSLRGAVACSGYSSRIRCLCRPFGCRGPRPTACWGARGQWQKTRNAPPKNGEERINDWDS